MKNKIVRGFALIELIAALVIFAGGFVVAKKVATPGPSKNETALTEEKANAAKTGQQFAAATTKEIAKAKDQTDPAVVAASKTAARADVALNAGLGALTPAQSQWVQNLVEANEAAFNVALNAKDKELIETGNKITDLERKVASERQRSDWFQNLLIGAAVVFVFINFVLPWLETMFPALGAFVGAIHAVANPFLNRLKAQAQADIEAAQTKLQTLYSQAGQAVTDMRAKLGSAAASAVAHLDNNLDQEHIDAIAQAARTYSAQQAAAQAAAKAAVEITAS